MLPLNVFNQVFFPNWILVMIYWICYVWFRCFGSWRLLWRVPRTSFERLFPTNIISLFFMILLFLDLQRHDLLIYNRILRFSFFRHWGLWFWLVFYFSLFLNNIDADVSFDRFFALLLLLTWCIQFNFHDFFLLLFSPERFRKCLFILSSVL